MSRQIVLGGLSGTGKDTVRNGLLGAGLVARGVTCTTRPQRHGEVDGRDYDFLTIKEFEALRSRGGLAEETIYIGNPVAYGITWERVNKAKDAELPTAWILDTVGLERLKELFVGDVVSVFMYANILTLAERMKGRGEDNETILRRLKRYGEERSLGLAHFDHAIDTTGLSGANVLEEVKKLIGGGIGAGATQTISAPRPS